MNKILVFISLLVLNFGMAHADERNTQCETVLDTILDKPCYLQPEVKNFILTAPLCTKSEKKIFSIYANNRVYIYDTSICSFKN